MMANKKMKRALSATLAMSMCMSMMATATFAAEENAAQDDNKTTVTVTIGSGTAEDPAVTSTTTTTTESVPNTTKTETTVDTDTSWSGETTKDTATTTITGQSASTESTITDRQDRPREVSGSESGQESTVVVDTKVSTSQSSDPLVSDTTKGDTDSSSSRTDNDMVYDPDVSIPDEQLDLEYGEDYGDVTVELKPGDKDITAADGVDVQNFVTLPEKPADATDLEDGSGYTYTTKTTAEDGSVIETTVEVLYTRNDQGEIVGYQTSQTAVATAPSATEKTVDDPVVQTPVVTQGQDEVIIETTILLPERPVAAEPTLDPSTRQTTTSSVEDIFNEDGEIVAYRITTQVTDKDGQVISSNSQTLWGDETTTTTVISPTTTETTSTQKTTHTTTTQITTGFTQSGLIVTATDREVTASMGSVELGDEHGIEFDMQSSLIPTYQEPDPGTVDTDTDLYNVVTYPDPFDPDSAYHFQYLGEGGLESAIRVDDTKEGENTWRAHQFILRDRDGNPFYAYCADFQTSATAGFDYGLINLEDATYYQSKEAAAHIRAIARLGFWGTDSGLGSMEHIKTYLKSYGQAVTGMTDTEIDSLTPGEALTTTQAAIWTYGNSSSQLGVNTEDIVGQYYKGDGKGFITNYTNDLVQTYYEFLVNQMDEATGSNVLLDSGSILGSSITVKDQVSEGTYNTDISFSLEVSPTDDCDLTVTVVGADGTVYATKQLDSGISDIVINDVVLPDGTAITLNLEGVQNLSEGGVYLYTSEVRVGQGKDGGDLTSQTFVGLATGKRSVDLEVDLEFRVTEPEAQLSQSLTTGSKSDTATKVDVRIDTTVEIQVEKDMEVTEVTVSRSDREWSKSWKETYSYSKPNRDKDDDKPETPEVPETPETPEIPENPEEPVPHNDDFPIPEQPEEPVPYSDDFPIQELPENPVPLADKSADDLLELPEDPVPLAAVPKTGISTIPQVMSLFSGLSLLGLGLMGRKKKD